MAENKPKLDEKESLRRTAGAMAGILARRKASPRGEPEVEEEEKITPEKPDATA